MKPNRADFPDGVFGDARYEGELHAWQMDQRIKDAGPSLTIQAPADELNINTIVKRFGISDGSIPPAALDPSYFGDFSDSPQDFRDALDKTRAAQLHFDLLPADIRTKFLNRPENLYQWITDPKNQQEAIDLGLLDARTTSPTNQPTPLPSGSSGTATPASPTTSAG